MPSLASDTFEAGFVESSQYLITSRFILLLLSAYDTCCCALPVCTSIIASSNSVTRKVLAEISIESEIQSLAQKMPICDLIHVSFTYSSFRRYFYA